MLSNGWKRLTRSVPQSCHFLVEADDGKGDDPCSGVAASNVETAIPRQKGGNMRFIVDLYRYLIFGILAVLIIGVVFGGLQLGASAAIPQWVLGIYVAGGLAVAVVLIMLIGLTATIISIHDRHVELVEAIHAWREDTFE